MILASGRKIILLAASMAGFANTLSAVDAPTSPPQGKPINKALVLRAEKAFSAGNMQEADSLYAKALDDSGDNASLLVSLAAVKTRMGKTAESTALLRRALKIDLSYAPAWLLLGMNALEQKNDAEALADLMQAVYLDDRNPRAHNFLGIAAGHKGWSEVSEQELRRAVELNPDYADANFNLAVFYLSRTPPLIEQARRHYQRALDLGTQRDAALESKLVKAVSTPTPAIPQAPGTQE
jgi:tetratricopeptide (TPR) repeat protein